MWNSLYAKVKAALVVAIPLDTAFIIAALSGETTWRNALILCATTDLPVLAAYLKTETKVPA